MTINDAVNAFCSFTTLEPTQKGILSGLTCGVKDLYDFKGHVTGYGNPDWLKTHAPAQANAEVVDDLLGAGIQCVGKTHTDEIAYSLMGVNAHYGTPVNIKAPERVPGGSSSGSAAATAAGLVDVGLGSDTGGSVRLPASFCGLFGMRTTHGRISLKGACPLAPSFDTVGWFTRDLETFAKVSEALGLNNAPKEITELLFPEDIWALADPAVAEALKPSLTQLEELYGPLKHISLTENGLGEWRQTFQTCQAHEIWECHGDWVSQNNPDFGPGIRERFDMASRISTETAQTAQNQRRLIREQMNVVLGQNKILVLPTSPSPAPLRDADAATLDDFRTRALNMLCVAGLCGLPQFNLPVADVDTAPIGLSLLGGQNMDETLLSVASKFYGT